MASIEIEFKINKKILRLAKTSVFLLKVINVITLGLIKDRLIYQAEKVADLVAKSIQVNTK